MTEENTNKNETNYRLEELKEELALAQAEKEELQVKRVEATSPTEEVANTEEDLTVPFEDENEIFFQPDQLKVIIQPKKNSPTKSHALIHVRANETATFTFNVNFATWDYLESMKEIAKYYKENDVQEEDVKDGNVDFELIGLMMDSMTCLMGEEFFEKSKAFFKKHFNSSIESSYVFGVYDEVQGYQSSPKENN